MKFIFILPFLTAMLASCGRPAADSGEAKKTVKITQDEIDTIMNNQYFTCDSLDDGDCPSGIARVFILDIYTPERSSVCSGFMVDENTMVTNNHCVPNQRKCDNTYIAVYDGKGTYTKTKCQRVLRTRLDYSNPSDRRKSLDYTVLTTADPVYSDPMEVSYDGVRAGQKVSAFVVDHKGFYNARISQFDCHVSDQSRYSSIVLEKCPVIGGNSGSPVLDANGRVLGVIWGTSLNDSVHAGTPMRARRNLTGFALMTDILKVNGL